MSRHLREHAPDEETGRVTFVELFFDLAYVLATAQLSARLAHDLTWRNAAETAFLLAVVWWAWIYTTWMTSWFHPDRLPVRLVLLVVLLGSQLMSVSITTGFEEGAGLFTGAYVGLQLARNLFNVVVIDRSHALARPLDRILAWSIITAPLWIAGAAFEGGARWAAWGVALGLELVAPSHGYLTPILGRSQTSEWTIDAGHFAERFQLFVIIALGEAIVVTGATASSIGVTRAVAIALSVCIVLSALLWWLYFHAVAHHSERRLTHADDPGRFARNAYTYGHLPIVAGIIVAAVGCEFVVAHPDEHLRAGEALALAGGPALYLVGHILFRLLMIGTVAWARVVAIGALLGVIPLLTEVPATYAAGVVVGVLTALVVWEAARHSVDGDPDADVVPVEEA